MQRVNKIRFHASIVQPIILTFAILLPRYSENAKTLKALYIADTKEQSFGGKARAH